MTAAFVVNKGDNVEFYDQKKWKEKREHILRRDSYQCQVSKRYGKLLQAEIVHHIFPREEFPQYEYCDWNLTSVTKKVHNLLHDRETNELTEKGRELLIRTARRNGIEIPPKYMKPIKARHMNGRPHTI